MLEISKLVHQNYKWFEKWFECPEKITFYETKIFIDSECFSELFAELLKI